MNVRSKSLQPSLWDRFQFIALGPRDLLLKLICSSYHNFIWGFTKLPPWYMAWTSRIRARRAFFNAVRNVPAYADYIKSSNSTSDNIHETDKDSYIKAFSPDSRCVGGKIPGTWTMIDESAGSTGTPYNWVRSMKERRYMHLFISYFATYCFGSKPWITINAFSMGSWATGHNMGLALQRNSIVKNTGPDIDKILHTMEFFGKHNTYLIMGYPPFLKHLIDIAETKGFPIQDYRMNAIAGGEGMSEGLRDYLLNRFEKVYSGYGATDLEIGIAGETPIAVAIRRLARDNPLVREKLFGKDSRLPMLFQYNPITHYIEVNKKRELICTITRPSMLSPRIRYNVHDEGGIARYDEISEVLTSLGYNIKELAMWPDNRQIRLPFLWVYGRSDYTISIMGANIYPEDLEQCLYADRELARITRSFCLSLHETPQGGVRPLFLFEVEVEPDENLMIRYYRSIVRSLADLNADFREAQREYSAAVEPEIQLYAVGQGPFKEDEWKIKQKRFLKKL